MTNSPKSTLDKLGTSAFNRMQRFPMNCVHFRGKGPLKTTMDVINAAKKISEHGTRLDKLARSIADQCPESDTKKDLIAYLQRIALYCHQLNITSKVKADVQNISGNLIVSGVSMSLIRIENRFRENNLSCSTHHAVELSKYFKRKFSKRLFPQLDSATSLIQAAKNLMNAVVLTVKASYVASTKYPRQGAIVTVSTRIGFFLMSTVFRVSLREYFPILLTVLI